MQQVMPVIAVVHFTDGLVAGGRAAPHFFDASGVNYADDVVNGDGGLSHVCGHYYLAHSLPSPLKHPCLQPIPVHMLPTTYVSGVAPTLTQCGKEAMAPELMASSLVLLTTSLSFHGWRLVLSGWFFLS